MPDFIPKLVDRVDAKREVLRETLRYDAQAREADLCELMAHHWHPLPVDLVVGSRRGPAFAIDGSVRRASLANGAFLFTAQALLIGEGHTETAVDVEILRGTVPRSSLERFADLFLQRLEIGLARDYVQRIPEGSVIFIDGALYGQLPQLYPLTIEGVPYPFPEEIIEAYLELFESCRRGSIVPISIAKTSHEATHAKIWAETDGMALSLEVPDSEMIYRWTGERAGYSTPVILGTWGFTRGSQILIDRGALGDAPAIISFFVRLADYDDAVRVDVPAYCLEDGRRIGDVTGETLQPYSRALHQILQILASDYGGLEVYNALLYAVDREVRLERQMMHEVYLKLIQNVLGCEVKLDRSDRRF